MLREGDLATHPPAYSVTCQHAVFQLHTARDYRLLYPNSPLGLFHHLYAIHHRVGNVAHIAIVIARRKELDKHKASEIRTSNDAMRMKPQCVQALTFSQPIQSSNTNEQTVRQHGPKATSVYGPYVRESSRK
ncbi:hypothetical protein CBL_04586 [Carabus blaptoides fortunei]